MPPALIATLGTLVPVLAQAGGGVVKGIAGAMGANKQNQHEKDMATINQTDKGLSDFGSDMVDDPDGLMAGAMKPTIFPGPMTPKSPLRPMMKKLY